MKSTLKHKEISVDTWIAKWLNYVNPDLSCQKKANGRCQSWKEMSDDTDAKLSFDWVACDTNDWLKPKSLRLQVECIVRNQKQKVNIESESILMCERSISNILMVTNMDKGCVNGFHRGDWSLTKCMVWNAEKSVNIWRWKTRVVR